MITAPLHGWPGRPPRSNGPLGAICQPTIPATGVLLNIIGVDDVTEYTTEPSDTANIDTRKFPILY